MEKEEMKDVYITPVVEIIEFQIEDSIASSGDSAGLGGIW